MMSGFTFSILGDSYSTFMDHIPKGYAFYYPRPESVADVISVEDIWWHKLINRLGMRLLVNDSYSGSTVCTCVRNQQPVSASFTKRVHHSFCGDDGAQPDYIFVFGCTNDSSLKREIGQVQYESWSEDDLKSVLPAYCYVLDQLSAAYKNSKIVTLINTGLHPDITKGIILSSDYYGAIAVRLHDIDKQNGHPSALGMSQIADQICEIFEQKLLEHGKIILRKGACHEITKKSFS